MVKGRDQEREKQEENHALPYWIPLAFVAVMALLGLLINYLYGR